MLGIILGSILNAPILSGNFPELKSGQNVCERNQEVGEMHSETQAKAWFKAKPK
ncbi:hypothetical protein FRC09_020031, partial [Ceratobasidium sp. 395]